nr:MAG TPA: hypothetical protein [Bacteriophage sp.]
MNECCGNCKYHQYEVYRKVGCVATKIANM